MSRVLVPLAKGFEEIEAVTIIDVLRRAEIEPVVAALDNILLVQGANDIVVRAENILEEVDIDSIDMIVLPGGWDGTYALADDANVQRILKEFNAKGKNIAAICAAPYALNKAGVLPQNYTCYPSVEEEIKLDGYQGDKSMIVEEGNVMTSRGPGTSMCFALEIVKKLKGEEMYETLKGGLLATYCK
jgi:4-methyl-5(b-hydroxyethyl)-thiazole monophosphate biosynthesis